MRTVAFTTRAVAGFVDLLIVIGLHRLPDVIGFLAAAGYLLVRDGLFNGQSLGKKLTGLRVERTDGQDRTAGYRDSLIRNTPLAVAYLLFLIPYAGWVLGPAALAVEGLTALGDERGMRIGDLLADTVVVPAAAAGPEQQEASAQHEPEPAAAPGVPPVPEG